MANSESCLSFTKKAKRKRDLNFEFAYGELTKLLFFFASGEEKARNICFRLRRKMLQAKNRVLRCAQPALRRLLRLFRSKCCAHATSQQLIKALVGIREGCLQTIIINNKKEYKHTITCTAVQLVELSSRQRQPLQLPAGVTTQKSFKKG